MTLFLFIFLSCNVLLDTSSGQHVQLFHKAVNYEIICTTAKTAEIESFIKKCQKSSTMERGTKTVYKEGALVLWINVALQANE